jgi:hypothetical protein
MKHWYSAAIGRKCNMYGFLMLGLTMQLESLKNNILRIWKEEASQEQ